MDSILNQANIKLALLETLYIVGIILIITTLANTIRSIAVTRYSRYLTPKLAKFIDNRLTFIGVIHHELSHALLALLTGAKIVECKLFKVKNGELGHVKFITRGPAILKSIQKTLCGIAPILCGCITLYLLYYYGYHERPELDTISAMVLVLAMQISYHMSASKQDIIIALKGSILAIPALFILFLFISLDVQKLLEYVVIVIAILAINLLLSLIVSILGSIFG